MSEVGTGVQPQPAKVARVSAPAPKPLEDVQDDTRQTLILPSLVQQASVQTAPVAEPAVQSASGSVTAADIRAVTGNRVNVRGGPGKGYDVVNRMTRGQEVEILSDPGTGWVKLRPLDGGTVGWMADFLLTSG